MNDLLTSEPLDSHERILPRAHPSFGTGKALFHFAMRNLKTGEIRRVLTVEAGCPYAVLTMERILAADQRVSDTCEVMSVCRDYRNFGTRNHSGPKAAIDEVPYIDFMIDIVDPARLLEDSITLTAFARSLSEEDKARYIAKCEEKDSVDETWRESLPKRAPGLGLDVGNTRPIDTSAFLSNYDKGIDWDDFGTTSPTEETEETEEQPRVDHTDTLIGALCGFGFQRAKVQKWVNSIGDRVHTDPIQDLVKAGLRALA